MFDTGATITDTSQELCSTCFFYFFGDSWTVVIDLAFQGVVRVAEGCRKLVSVSLHGNTHVTDVSMEALSQGPVDSLVALDVSGCVGIKHRSID